MFEIPQPATALHRFAEHYHQSIQYAALQLGGTDGLRRAQRLLDDLSRPKKITHWTLREAKALSILFRHEPAPANDRNVCMQAAGWSQAIDDADEIRRLADALREAIAQTATRAIQDTIQCQEKYYD